MNNTINEQNSISQALDAYENRIGATLKPDSRFYNKVGINQKRWGQLVRGEKPPFFFELKNLSELWDIPLSDLAN
jgi:hypothetical protein